MGFWSLLLKYGGKAAQGTGHAIEVTGKTLGSAAPHLQRTLMEAGKTMQMATVGSAAGYATWGKLTIGKNVTRIVGDTVIGENATEVVAQTANDVRRLTGKASEAVDAVDTVVGKMDTQFSGISDFFKNMFGGVGCDMIGNLFGNIGKDNVSDMSITGLVAAALVVFGRFSWMNKIAGAPLGAMIIGNNSEVVQTLSNRGGMSSYEQSMKGAKTQNRGMR